MVAALDALRSKAGTLEQESQRVERDPRCSQKRRATPGDARDPSIRTACLGPTKSQFTCRVEHTTTGKSVNPRRSTHAETPRVLRSGLCANCATAQDANAARRDARKERDRSSNHIDPLASIRRRIKSRPASIRSCNRRRIVSRSAPTRSCIDPPSHRSTIRSRTDLSSELTSITNKYCPHRSAVRNSMSHRHSTVPSVPSV